MTRYVDLCRLCANKTNIGLGIHIFENQGTSRQIDKKIETCLPIQVHEIDELPKMICEDCLYKLELLFDFRERSMHTQTYLMNLYKEITVVRLQSKEIVEMAHSMDIVNIDQPDLMMVQQQQLLNEHNIQSVGDLDLGQLDQRENMIVGHEIILAQQNVEIPHGLDNLNLNHQDITSQDLSNHSLQGQNGILLDDSGAVHTIQGNQYAEGNLQLIQQDHQIIADQYRLQHDLHHVEIPGNATVGDIQFTETVQDSSISNDQESNIHSPASPKIENNDSNSEFKYQRSNSSNSDKFKVNISREFVEKETSENHILIEGQLQEAKPVYLLQQTTNATTLTDKYFYCNLCGKSFNDKSLFQDHYEQHINKCSLCLVVLTSRDALAAHRKEVHGSSLEDTKVASENDGKPKSMKGEISQEHESNTDSDDLNDPEPLPDEEEPGDASTVQEPTSNGKRKKWSPKICKECGKSYKTNYKLMEHMRKHTGEKPYKCKTCEKAFRSKIGLAQHEAKHTGQYDFSCPTCGKGFQCKSYLMVHQRVHSDVKPYPCTTCGQNFKTKQSLLDHTNRHLGVKPYMCEICGRGFITKGLCRAHQKIHTGQDNRKYSCKVCNKMFVSKSYLQTHLRIHTGEKPFICEVCGKGFLTRVDLRIHSTMHTGEKRYVCEMCGKAFARRDALRCHRRSHTGERPYSCDQCGQTFTQFSPMAIHKRLHTGERPYVCEVCGKKFVSKSTMMAHSKKHDR